MYTCLDHDGQGTKQGLISTDSKPKRIVRVEGRKAENDAIIEKAPVRLGNPVDAENFRESHVPIKHTNEKSEETPCLP